MEMGIFIVIILCCLYWNSDALYSTESLAFQRTDVNPSYAFLAKRPRLRTPELYEFTVCMHVNVAHGVYVLTEDIVTWDYDNHTFSLATEVSANAFKIQVYHNFSWIYTSSWEEFSHPGNPFEDQFGQFCFIRHAPNNATIIVNKEVAAFMYVNPYWGIAANAWIAFGNDHDSRTGGDFDGNENWFGLLTNVNIWSYAITDLNELDGQGDVMSTKSEDLVIKPIGVNTYQQSFGDEVWTVYNLTEITLSEPRAVMVEWPSTVRDNLQEITITWAMNLQGSDPEGTQYLFSLASYEVIESLSVAWVPLEGRFSITINQEVGACAVELMKPGWSHFALTWSSANNGSWNLWFGDKKICDGNLAANSTIYGGALGLAARQQKFVMPMEAPYTGLLSGVNIHNAVLSGSILMELKTTITCLGGNVISWSADTIDVENNGITITINEMLCGTKSKLRSTPAKGDRSASALFCQLKSFSLGQRSVIQSLPNVTLARCVLGCLAGSGGCLTIEHDKQTCVLLSNDVGFGLANATFIADNIIMSPQLCP